MPVISCIPPIRHRRALPWLALALVLSACGGDGPGVVDPPPAPDNVAARVEIVSPAETVQANQTLQLSATVRNAAGVVLSGKTVAWQSASDAVASVTAAGLVRANGPGQVTLSAIETASGRSGSMSLSVLPAPVATLAIAPAALSVQEGTTQPLAVTARDANGNVLAGRAVVWSSADATVAAVDAVTGAVRGVRAGAGTTITATSEGKSATAEVTVTPVPVASLTMEPASIWLHPGGTRTLTIAARDAAGNVLPGRSVTLISSNADVVTVSGGVVTAVGLGMAALTATSEGKTAVSQVTVTPVPVASLSIEPSSISLHPRGTQPLTITARDSEGNVLPGRRVTITTSNSAVAIVPGGVVTAMDPGTATITATTEGGETATATVTVTLAPIASLTLEPSSIALLVGGTQALAIVARDAAGNVLTGRTVTLASSSSAVATVWGNVVTATGAGSATLTAIAEGMIATARVDVRPVPVASVSIEPASIALQVGEPMMPSVFALDSAGNRLGRSYTLVSSDASVVTVDRGLITGAGPGSATLTATSEGRSATASVTVTRALVASLRLEPDSLSLLEGARDVPLRITARDAWGNMLAGRAITLVSSDASVATVSGSLLNAIGVGNATITASCEGKADTSFVNVWRDAVNYVTLSPSGFTINPGSTRQMTATTWGSFSGHVLTGRVVTWSSSVPAVATVDASGVVTGHAPGATVITATSEGKSGSGNVTVGEAGRVEVTPGFAVLDVGASTTLRVNAYTAGGQYLIDPAVQWGSLSPTVAGVDAGGRVTAASPGQARIVAGVDAARDTATIAALGAQSVLSTAFAGGEARADVWRGQTIIVPVVLDLSRVSSNGDLGAAQFELRFDPAVLVFQSATAGVTGQAEHNVPAPGTFRFSFAATSPQGSARLTLVTIVFQVAPGAAPGTRHALGLTYTAQPAKTSFAKYALPIAVGGRVKVQ